MPVRGRDVLEAMVDAGVVVDTGGRIVAVNSAVARISGCATETLYGLPIERLLESEYGPVREQITDRVTMRNDGWCLLGGDGERVPVSIHATPTFDDTGEFTGVMLIARDLRETHQLRQKLAAEVRQRQLVESELHDLHATIEHRIDEVRAKLRHVLARATYSTLADGLAREVRDLSACCTSLLATFANDDATRVAELARIRDVLAARSRWLREHARPGPDRVAATDLNRATASVAEMLDGSGLLGGIELVLVLGKHPVFVAVNKALVEQVELNLVLNSVDAIGRSRGRVLLAVHASEQRDHVVVEVSDNGPGISADVLPHIFEPFYTTRSDGRAGLGLPVVREIVEGCGGTLTVTTNAGVGATFKIDLPTVATAHSSL